VIKQSSSCRSRPGSRTAPTGSCTYPLVARRRKRQHRSALSRLPPHQIGGCLGHRLELAHAFLAATAHQPWEKGAEQLRHPGSSGSQWRRFGDSWQLVAPTPALERTPRTTPRAELVELAPPTPSSRPPLSLPAAMSHDRRAVSVRPPPHDRSPATLPPPGEGPGQTANPCWSTKGRRCCR
jgi:hypothetical protein